MITSFPCSRHYLVSTVDGVYSWGCNEYGQLGIGKNNSHQNIPQKVINNSNEPISIGCGWGHSIIATNEGVFSFGSNQRGQLGLGHRKSCNKPQEIELFSSTQIISISCGCNHSMILTCDGIFSWGCNLHGQLGLGHYEDQSVPQRIEIEQEVISIICGAYHSMILTSDGIFTWGLNTCGQLGLGHDKIQLDSPQKMELVSSSNEVRSIVCGGNHSMILTSDGSLFSWGSNLYGQLGLGKKIGDYQTKPSKISFEFGNIISIGCGLNYSILSSCDGMFSWGDTNSKSKPQRMEWDNIDIAAIYCRDNHAIIFNSKGIFSWGKNEPELFIMNSKDMKVKLKSTSTLMWELQRIIWFGKLIECRHLL